MSGSYLVATVLHLSKSRMHRGYQGANDGSIRALLLMHSADHTDFVIRMQHDTQQSCVTDDISERIDKYAPASSESEEYIERCTGVGQRCESVLPRFDVFDDNRMCLQDYSCQCPHIHRARRSPVLRSVNSRW